MCRQGQQPDQLQGNRLDVIREVPGQDVAVQKGQDRFELAHTHTHTYTHTHTHARTHTRTAQVACSKRPSVRESPFSHRSNVKAGSASLSVVRGQTWNKIRGRDWNRRAEVVSSGEFWLRNWWANGHTTSRRTVTIKLRTRWLHFYPGGLFTAPQGHQGQSVSSKEEHIFVDLRLLCDSRYTFIIIIPKR